MRINHNIAALNTYRQLSANQALGNKSLEKLSSGLRINRAGDDAAGLAISEKMRGQIRGLDQAARNAQDGISLIQTAEGALNETHSILQRMRELAVQATNDTNTNTDRNEIQKEIQQLISEVDRIANTTEFNTKVLMKGNYGTTASSDAPTNVAIKSALASTITSGTYAITVSNAAVQGTDTGNADISSGVTITEGSNDTLVLNGVTIKFSSGSWSSTQIVNKINEYKAQTGLEASISGSFLKLTNTKYGAQTNTIEGSAKTTLLGNITSVAGEDAVVQVGGQAVAQSADATDGRIVTINAGALKGIVLDVKGADSSTANVTVTKSSLTMQIGANENQNFSMSFEDMGARSLGIDAIDVTSATNASRAITTINKAIEYVSAERSKLGAYQNRLEHTINNLGTASENLSAAESRIRDVDMAKEMMEFTKMNILQQAATAMLAQANQQPQMVLQLLGR